MLHSDTAYMLRESPFLFLLATGGTFARQATMDGSSPEIMDLLESVKAVLEGPVPETAEGLAAVAAALVIGSVTGEYNRDHMSSADIAMLYDDIADISDRIRALEGEP